MPVHNWSKVNAGTFHHFHQSWITAISDVLNGGLLPGGYYAMAEQVAGSPHPDVLTLEESEPPACWLGADDRDATAIAVATNPPQVRYTLEADETRYAAKANRIAIHHVSGDRVVAFLEIVSLGNKRSRMALNQLLDKLAAALEQGRHLLVIDLHPPGHHDPDGLHVAFWGCLPGVTNDQPFGLAAYRADTVATAYFEPIGIGDALPDMPLFLTSDHYVNVPLEATYQSAWRGVPQRWRAVIEG